MTKHDAHNQTGYALGLIDTEIALRIEYDNHLPSDDDGYVNGELVLYARYWLSQPEEAGWRESTKWALRGTQAYNFSGVTEWTDNKFTYDALTPEQRLAKAAGSIAAEITRRRRFEKGLEETGE
jgi:hypothetical protein